jgi:sulfur-oxidizing protein SoxY
MKRRIFLRGSLAAGVTAAAAAAGLLVPGRVLAAWPAAAFEAKTVDDALNELVGSASSEESGDITIKAPDIAENGAVVPVSVTTGLANVTSISIVAMNNPSPLTASFDLGPGTEGYVATRIKMGKTSNVLAVVKADGKLYSTKKEVKVTIGGCGG